jgi:5-methylcytosine-specific restriction endonuclease McrA
MMTKRCPICERNFEVHPYRALAAKYCSYACRDEARRKKETRRCQYCGGVFSALPSRVKHYKGAGTYCSRECSYAGQVKRNARKPIDDRYGRSNRKADKDWQAAVRNKDNLTCQRCGKHEPYIHTHHVASRKRRPDLRHDVANGKCLCGTCHQWVHANPTAAEKLGLLSGAKYELARRQQRATNISGSLRFDDLRERVLELHRKGLLPQRIADELGCSGTPVRRILREAGVPGNPPGRPRDS